jgi:two-component system sensor histidine kinase PilS (NtrC family)
LYLLESWRRNAYDWHSSSLSLLSSDSSSLLQPHFVALQKVGQGPTLIFLEDTTLIAERVQQSKLAALGRLSASIAHEIRNPVGAMSHAAQLLAEDPQLQPQEQRLINIITSNASRVSTIIDNVLQLSRRDSTRQERLEINSWLTEFLSEFRQTLQVDAQILQLVPPAAETEVRVDPTHLHQLMWNLCENALKYGHAPDEQASIEIRSGRMSMSERPFVEVADRGPGITAGDAERIFEPFFTAGEGGTGLGLFIARELAQCNRAILVYEPRNGGGSIFRVVFADPQRWELQ